jgi:hypothetical protein
MFTSFIKSSAVYASDKIDCPEKRLFIAILSQAVHDAFAPHVPRLEKQAARNFLTNNSPDFKHICEMAGRDANYVKEKIRKKVLRDKGWNVDVAIRISSPRRRKQMRNINKKHLTGNAYYAAKKQAAALSQGTH